MPIKTLVANHQPGQGLPRIGKLFKGAPKPENGNRPGSDLDHFRIEFEPQFEHLRPIWEDLYGEKPVEFSPVFLAGATVDEVFGFWNEEWTATTMLHRCDGEEQHQWWQPSAGMYSRARVACVGKDENGKQLCGCKPIGRLNLILPEFIDAAGVLGVIAATTHSLNDIMTLHRYLKDIETVYGALGGVPFVFGRAKKELSAPKNNKNGTPTGERMKITKSLFYLHVTPEFTRVRLLPALHNAGTMPALPESIDDAPVNVRLGAGDREQRRIGAPKHGASNDEPAADAPHWTTDSKAVNGFFSWAAKTVDFTQEDVITALHNASDGDVNLITDYRGDKREAVAAVIACAVNYDLSAIEQFTSSGGFEIETYEAAVAIAKRVEGELPVEDAFGQGEAGAVEV